MSVYKKLEAGFKTVQGAIANVRTVSVKLSGISKGNSNFANLAEDLKEKLEALDKALEEFIESLSAEQLPAEPPAQPGAPTPTQPIAPPPPGAQPKV